MLFYLILRDYLIQNKYIRIINESIILRGRYYTVISHWIITKKRQKNNLLNLFAA